MGEVRTEITVVDTGAWTETKGLLVINEETREKLGLRAEETAETIMGT